MMASETEVSAGLVRLVFVYVLRYIVTFVKRARTSAVTSSPYHKTLLPSLLGRPAHIRP